MQGGGTEQACCLGVECEMIPIVACHNERCFFVISDNVNFLLINLAFIKIMFIRGFVARVDIECVLLIFRAFYRRIA